MIHRSQGCISRWFLVSRKQRREAVGRGRMRLRSFGLQSFVFNPLSVNFWFRCGWNLCQKARIYRKLKLKIQYCGIPVQNISHALCLCIKIFFLFFVCLFGGFFLHPEYEQHPLCYCLWGYILPHCTLVSGVHIVKMFFSESSLNKNKRTNKKWFLS